MIIVLRTFQKLKQERSKGVSWTKNRKTGLLLSTKKIVDNHARNAKLCTIDKMIEASGELISD